jgi:hypothetical protein
MKKINNYLRMLVNYYNNNFAILFIILLMLILALSVNEIPYINLISHLASTTIITACFLLFFLVNKSNNSLNKILISLGLLLFFSFLLNIFSFEFQSEILGNVFYLILFYATMREVFKKTD